MKVLYVCIANTCRSPALMATLNHLAIEKGVDVQADSCGIGWVHLGQRPNPKSFEAAKKKGILIDHLSKPFEDSFFEEYDLILTVNEEIREQLKMRGPKYKDKIQLATAYSSKYKNQAIPDPYYLSDSGFDEVMEIILDCCRTLLEKNKR